MFARLQHQAWAILLESAGPTGADNRFDIISADPLATLETRGACTSLRHAGSQTLHEDDPLTLLARTQLPVGEVASRCGYQNQGAFAERFLAETGLTPSLWRRQNGCLP